MSAREPEPTEATLDSALMARAQTGDESAFEALYERRFGEVSAFLRRRLPGASAEDQAGLEVEPGRLYGLFRLVAASGLKEEDLWLWQGEVGEP